MKHDWVVGELVEMVDRGEKNARCCRDRCNPAGANGCEDGQEGVCVVSDSLDLGSVLVDASLS